MNFDGRDRAVVADAQRAVVLVQRDQPAVPVQHRVVGLDQIPAHGRAHLGIVAAGHVQLGAVVQVGRAGQRELQHLREAALRRVGQRAGEARVSWLSR
jgi:hypothetical protein